MCALKFFLVFLLAKTSPIVLPWLSVSHLPFTSVWEDLFSCAEEGWFSSCPVPVSHRLDKEVIARVVYLTHSSWMQCTEGKICAKSWTERTVAFFFFLPLDDLHCSASACLHCWKREREREIQYRGGGGGSREQDVSFQDTDHMFPPYCPSLATIPLED